MYRSYSVNDMPQPIRYNGRSRPPQSHGFSNSNVHTENISEGAVSSECPPRTEQCPPPVEPCPPSAENTSPAECPTECPIPPSNLPCKCIANCPMQCAQGVQGAQNNNGGLLAGLNLKSDDLVLLAVVVILLMDGCDDKLLIAALGLVFFSDYFGL